MSHAKRISRFQNDQVPKCLRSITFAPCATPQAVSNDDNKGKGAHSTHSWTSGVGGVKKGATHADSVAACLSVPVCRDFMVHDVTRVDFLPELNTHNGHETYPIRSPSDCWYDSHAFDTPPIGIPFKIIDSRFYLHGFFCSFSCALAYLSSQKTTATTSELCHNVHRLRRYVRQCADRLRRAVESNHHSVHPADREWYESWKARVAMSGVPMAPDRSVLEKYGGTMSIQSFRNYCDKESASDFPLVVPNSDNFVPLGSVTYWEGRNVADIPNLCARSCRSSAATSQITHTVPLRSHLVANPCVEQPNAMTTPQVQQSTKSNADQKRHSASTHTSRRSRTNANANANATSTGVASSASLTSSAMSRGFLPSSSMDVEAPGRAPTARNAMSLPDRQKMYRNLIHRSSKKNPKP